MKPRSLFLFASMFAVGIGSVIAAPQPADKAAQSPQNLPLVTGVELQPLVAQIKRLVETLDNIGEPLLTPEQKTKLSKACEGTDGPEVLSAVQEILDPHCLIGIQINPESRVKAAVGPVRPELVEQGWRTYLIKVNNQASVTAELKAESSNAQNVYRTDRNHVPEMKLTPADVRDRWLDLNMYGERPQTKQLSGLSLEYRILQVFSRDAGDREATIGFNVGQGTQDLGFRSDVAILFHAKPSAKVKFQVLDEDGKPTMGRFIIRDEKGRIYPSQAKRLAPDFFFHPQIYRADGESVTLPAGSFIVEYTRGPEYITQSRHMTVDEDAPDQIQRFEMRRWIHPAKMGWFSGDHHVHAAGCSHYTDPQQGVKPEDMMRQIVGENLDVGCVLTWGPCWYFQKQFFQGRESPLSTPDTLMRYDIEVSGFPSDFCGHLCLIGLKEDDFTYEKESEFDWAMGSEKGHFKGTKTKRIGEWPTWDLPILQWGKKQGAVVGFSHSGWGLHTKATDLPNMEIPPYDGIGANEYIVDVTHDAVDFISAADTPWPYELNIWYHTNNAGYRARLSGETDFPCIYSNRVGMGRVYTKLDGKLQYDTWMNAIKAGRSYISEGLAHLIDFKVNDRELGTQNSQLDLAKPEKVTINLKAAAYLSEKLPEARGWKIDQQPYWYVERARIGDTRKVPVEIIVNGLSVARQEIEADGAMQDLKFDIDIQRSSWVAARIFAAAHTNPIYVVVDKKPIRASRKSVQWCLDGVDQCWKQKSEATRLRESERAACQAAYDHAREAYKKLLSECDVD